MNECLITKLKANIQDDTLPKLGVLRVNLNPNFNAIPYYLRGKDCVLSVISGSVTLTSVNTSQVLSLPYSFDPMEGYIKINVGSQGAVVEISNKYNLTYLNGITEGASPAVELKDFMYSPGLVELYRVGGDTSVIKNNPKNFKNIVSMDLSSKGTTGTLSDLGTCTKVTKIVTNPSLIVGSIEDFVRAQRNNGRTSCDEIDMGWGNPKITFNGTPLVNDQINKTLSWTETTITYDGVTISA